MANKLSTILLEIADSIFDLIDLSIQYLSIDDLQDDFEIEEIEIWKKYLKIEPLTVEVNCFDDVDRLINMPFEEKLVQYKASEYFNVLSEEERKKLPSIRNRIFNESLGKHLDNLLELLRNEVLSEWFERDSFAAWKMIQVRKAVDEFSQYVWDEFIFEDVELRLESVESRFKFQFLEDVGYWLCAITGSNPECRTPNKRRKSTNQERDDWIVTQRDDNSLSWKIIANRLEREFSSEKLTSDGVRLAYKRHKKR